MSFNGIPLHLLLIHDVTFVLLERFSFAFTANAKRETGGCWLSEKQENYLILAYFSVFSTCSIAVANRQNIN